MAEPDVAPTRARLDEGRRLIARGDYSGAAILLQRLHEEHRSDLEIAIELAEVHVFQGYINRALELLERVAPVSPSQSPTELNSLQLVVGMMLSFFRAVTSGRFQQPVDEANAILSLCKGRSRIAPASQADHVLTFLYYSKLRKHLRIIRVTEYHEQLEDTETDLLAMFEDKFTTSSFDVALRIARTVSTLVLQARLLERLTSSPLVNRIIKGKAFADRAELAHKYDINRRQLLDEAARLLGAADYVGPERLDVAFTIKLQEFEDAPQTVTADFDPLLTQYKSSNAMNGFKRALHRLLDLTQDVFDWNNQFDIEEKLKVASLDTGTYSLWLCSHVNLLARYQLRGGNNDVVREGLELIWPQLAETDMMWTQGHAAYVLSEIFIQAREVGNAERWVAHCQSAWSTCGYEALSQANHQRIQLDLRVLENDPTLDRTTVVSQAEALVSFDLEYNLTALAMAKLELLATFYTRSGVHDSSQDSNVEAVLLQLRNTLDEYKLPDKPLKLASLYQQQAIALASEGSLQKHFELEQRAIALLENACKEVLSMSKGKLTFQLLVIIQQQGIFHHACFVKCKRIEVVELLAQHRKGLEAFEWCVRGFTAIGTTAQVAEAKYWVALQTYEGRVVGLVNSDQALEQLRTAEEAHDMLRAQISASKGLEAMHRKQLLTGDKHVRDVYRFAIQVALLSDDHRPEVAWNWLQKAKGRSLCDLLGLGATVPQSLLTQLSHDSVALATYTEEQALLEQASRSSAADLFSIRKRLAELRLISVDCEAFQTIRGLRDGSSIDYQGLRKGLATLPGGLDDQRSIIFVDWYIKQNMLYLVITSATRDPVWRILNISYEAVNRWVSTYLQDPEGREMCLETLDNDPRQPLRQLDPLIEPICDYSKTGDLLILVPSGIVSLLPIHALKVPPWSEGYQRHQSTLIERNPVVYCASITSFLQCCQKADSVPDQTHPSPAVDRTFSSVYEPMADQGDEFDEFDEVEQELAYESVRELSRTFQGESLVGEQMTIAAARRVWPSSALIHFHGHCHTDSKDIDRQALLLASGVDANNVVSSGADAVPSTVHLDVRECFTIPLASPHMTILACASAAQEINVGDEPLGLLTALLCAGAASVVGTLWPISSSTARIFANHFYEDLQNPSDPNGGRGGTTEAIVDLACAVQRAVIRLKRNNSTRSPWHWAAFVLHGSWFIRPRS